MNGQVPERTNYRDWLTRQSEATQREVLGATRYNMFKSGVPLKNFHQPNGRLYTLDQLKNRGYTIPPRRAVPETSFYTGAQTLSDTDYQMLARGKFSGKHLVGEQREVFDNYIKSGYRDMNSYLRTGEFANASTPGQTKVLANVFDQNRGVRLENPIVTWRGVEGSFANQVRALKPGDVLTDAGFGSMSTNSRVSGMFGNTMFKIEVPRGHQVLPGWAAQQELILKPGTRYRIMGQPTLMDLPSPRIATETVSTTVIRMQVIP